MKKATLLMLLSLVLLLAACASGSGKDTVTTETAAAPTVDATSDPPTEEAAIEEPKSTGEADAEETVDIPTAESEPEPTTAADITAVSFDLGNSIIEQEWVENEKFRDLPIRLQGMIAAPPTGDNLPIAIIIHGSHGSGCGTDEMGQVELWPCPEVENHHYEGFAYLAEALAEQGYVAVSINANPAFVSAFGDPRSNLRLTNLFDQYLTQIAAAVNGEAVDLGVDLAGRVDWNQLVVLGHSQGGEGVYWIVDGRIDHTTPEQINAGQGPVAAAILLAPQNNAVRDHDLAAPFVVILPECDRDVSGLGGQSYYEAARQAAERDDLAASIFLHNANHNRFNSTLGDEDLSNSRSHCASLLPADDVQSFLAAYVTQFFDVSLGRGEGNTAVLALDASEPAPNTVLGLPGLTSLVLPSAQRLILPLAEEGAVGTATVVYCSEGFIADEEKQKACGTFRITQPGTPEEMALTWNGSGAAYDVTVPADSGDLSAYEVLHLRTALNPASELNATGEPQSFSVQLTDGAGETAVVTLAGEPALAFPAGEAVYDDFYEWDTWDNNILLSSVRLPLAAFSDIDLTDVQAISLVFDATNSGTIFVTDLELLDVE